MDDTDKLEAALEQLEIEKARRLQTKIDAGTMVSIPTTVVLGPDDDDEEEAIARAIAKHPAPDDGRPIHRAFTFVHTGVPRAPDHGNEKEENNSPPAETRASSEGPSHPSTEEPAASGLLTCLQPTYVRIVTSNGSDGDPGAIAEAWYTIEDGLVVLRDSDDKVITSRAMLKGDDPAVLARSLLREAEQPKDFNRPIVYRKLGLA
jgi:hypothetical protein